jgi:hypothetical protein
MIKAIYEALPDDVKRKVSLHDLKRIHDTLFPTPENEPAARTLIRSLLQHFDANEPDPFFETFIQLSEIMCQMAAEEESEAAKAVAALDPASR